MSIQIGCVEERDGDVDDGDDDDDDEGEEYIVVDAESELEGTITHI